jgi:hypothetical protein
MANEPENLLLELLCDIRADIAETRVELRAVFRSEINALRADVASDLLTLNAKIDAENKATREQVAGLRRAVIEYHSAVVGHAILVRKLEARVRRVEQHLNVPSIDTN